MTHDEEAVVAPLDLDELTDEELEAIVGGDLALPGGGCTLIGGV